MTLTNLVNSVIRIGDGVQTVFTFPFSAVRAADILVDLIGVTGARTPMNPLHYVVTVGDTSGSVLIAAPNIVPNLQKIYIYRKTAAAQEAADAEAAASAAAASALAAATFNPALYLAKADKLAGLGNAVTALTSGLGFSSYMAGLRGTANVSALWTALGLGAIAARSSLLFNDLDAAAVRLSSE